MAQNQVVPQPPNYNVILAIIFTSLIVIIGRLFCENTPASNSLGFVLLIPTYFVAALMYNGKSR